MNEPSAVPGSAGAPDLARAATLLALAAAQPVAGRLSDLTGRGVPIEERSRRAQGPATPADGAFAIWAPIFLASLAFAVRSAVSPAEADPRRRRAEWLTAAAYAGNTAWSLQAQLRGLGWPSLGIIAGSAVAASGALLEAERSRDATSARLVAPLAGWLTVATFANLGATLNETRGRLAARTEDRRAVALVAAASLTAGAMTVASRGSLLYAGAAAWGLGGVVVRNVREGRGPVAAAAGLGLAALAAVALLAGASPRGPVGAKAQALR